MRPEGKITKQQFLRFCQGIGQDVGNGTSDEKRERYKSFLLNLVGEKAIENEAGIDAEKQRMPWLWTSAVAAAALLVGLLAFVYRPKSDMGFWIGREGIAGKVGEGISVPSGTRVPLLFRQGSRIELQERSTARIVQADEENVILRLNNGTVSADIEGNGKTRWSVNAGPFSVTVLGTKFVVSWAADEGVLDVEVERGAVLVSGANVGARGVEVSAGNHLRAIEKTGYLAMNATDSKLYSPKAIGLIAPLQPRSAYEPPITATTQNRSSRQLPEPLFAAAPTDAVIATAEAPRSIIAQTPNPINDDNNRVHPTTRDELGHADSTEQQPSTSIKIEKTAIQNQTNDTARIPRPAKTPVLSNSKKKKPEETVFRKIEPILETAPIEIATDSDQTEVSGKTTTQLETDENAAWLSFFEKRQYRQAFSAAEGIGIDHLIEALDSENLWKLIRTARLVGNEPMAEEALLVYRKRFAKTGRANRAAYLLGKLNDENDRNPEEASKWYETYLTENRDGSFYEEALGRLMKLYHRQKKHWDAKRRAREYLRKFPDGTFSDVARSLLYR